MICNGIKSTIYTLLLLCVPAILSAGEIVHLKFDENLNDSAGSHHGQHRGEAISYTADRFGNPNKAVLLKKGSRITLGKSRDLSLVRNGQNLSFTIEWFQCYDRNGDGLGVGIVRKAGEYQIMWNNKFRFRADDPANRAVLSRNGEIALKHGKWTHIAVVFENGGSDGIRFYQDGKLVSISKDGGEKGNFQSMVAGNSELIVGFNFEGALDDFIIHDRALSAEEIREKASTCRGTPGIGFRQSNDFGRGAVVHLKFDADLQDSAGNHHGRQQGVAVSYTTDRFGNPDGAVLFKKGSIIILGNSPDLSFIRDGKPCSFTIEWFQCYDRNGKGLGVGIVNKAGEYYIAWNNRFRLNATDPVNNTPLSRNGAVSLQKGKWTHIAVVFENTGNDGVRFYQDGVLLGSLKDPVDKGLFQNMVAGNSELIIGTNFEGAIDDFIIHDRALSADEIRLRSAPQVSAQTGTPILDGKLDDSCWKQAVEIREFSGTSGITPDGGAETAAYLTYDNEAIYVAFRCAFSGRSNADGDSVEVFLAPIPGREALCRFSVNSQGKITGLCHDSVSAAVSCDAKNWNVEIKIPFAGLQLPLVSGYRWGINLIRNNHKNGQSYVWASALAGYAVPERFATMFCPVPADLRNFQMRVIQTRINQLRQQISALPFQYASPLTSELANLSKIQDIEELIVKFEVLENKIRQARIENSVITAGRLQIYTGHALQKFSAEKTSFDWLPAQEITISAARDEAESFQVVVSSTDGNELNDVAVSGLELTNGSAVLKLSWHKVGFIRTLEEPSGYTNAPAGLYADPLLPPENFNVGKNLRQPLWFTIQVPENAQPGIYRGKIRITAGNDSAEIPVSVKVRSFILPRTLASAFGNYYGALTHFYKQDMPLDKFISFCNLMNQYRMGSKSAIREKTIFNGTDFDFSQVRQLLPETYPYDAGIYRAPVRCRHLENEIEFQRVINYYRQLTTHWRTQNLPETMFLYGIDEPATGGNIGFSSGDKKYLLPELYRQLKAIAPYPIMQTLNNTEFLDELVGAVDIWCPLLTIYAHNDTFFQNRLAAGDTLWLYTCNGDYPPTPNFYIERPGIEHRIIFWQTFREGATGFLYWAGNWWRVLESDWITNPVIKSDRGRNHGDGVLFYPAPDFEIWPSIRAEMIRDGIEDYEYLALLKKLTAELKVKKGSSHQALIDRAEALCNVDKITTGINHYTKSPEAIYLYREQVGCMIEEIIAVLK